MNDERLMQMARAAFSGLSFPMDDQRAREIADELAALEKSAATLRPGLQFDDVPSQFRQVLEAEPLPDAGTQEAGGPARMVSGGASEIATLDLATAAHAVRVGQISSRELVMACLSRIEKLQPRLNCFIEVEAEKALAAADRADAARAKGVPLGRLHGVPLAHKDIIYREGRVCSCGSKIRSDFRPKVTATALQRLDQHGAVDLGRLNTAEFAGGGTGHNGAFGACRNPWNVAHSPGGSSSGSASAVAARLVYGALGSDTGGSIRLPAAMCGVVGLKPTRGRVSCHGVMPRSWTTDVVGPVARTARDCAVMLEVLAGADPLDPDCAALPVPRYESLLGLGMEGMTIGVPQTPVQALPGIAAALEEVRATLQRLGARVVQVPMPDVVALFTLAEVILKSEAASLHEAWIRERPQDYDLGVRAYAESGLLIPAVRYAEAQRLRGPLLREFLATTLSTADVVLTPVLAQATPTLEACKPSSSSRAAAGMAALPRWTRWASFLGIPAVAVPCGFGEDGMPLSFQLAGRPFREDLLLRAAHAYQEATGWHRKVPAPV